jgi:type IV secretory pathway VirB10-like protein
MTTDPKRLFDTEGGDLTAAIGAARRRTADPPRMAAMGARLAGAGVLPPDGFGHSAASSSTSLAPAAAPAFSKWLITGIGVVGVASLALIASLFAARPQEGDASAKGAEVVKAVQPLVAREEAVPRAVSEPDPPAVREASEREAPEPEAATAVAPKSGATTPTATKTDVSEVQLLKDARDALGSNPARALALVERARSRFPKSTFGQEREFITISALYRLGRRAEAQSREQSFRGRYPKSAYIPQLDRLASRP